MTRNYCTIDGYYRSKPLPFDSKEEGASERELLINALWEANCESALRFGCSKLSKAKLIDDLLMGLDPWNSISENIAKKTKPKKQRKKKASTVDKSLLSTPDGQTIENAVLDGVAAVRELVKASLAGKKVPTRKTVTKWLEGEEAISKVTEHIKYWVENL